MRETLGEVALNRQDNEKDIPFFAPESEDISDGEESVHPALKDAGILCEGQEAMWVEDDVSEIFRRASSDDKYESKRKNTFKLFRGKRKAQKAVVLLPPQPVDKEDVENQENQPAPENNDDQAPNNMNESHNSLDGDEQKLREEEMKEKEGSNVDEDPKFESAEETNEQEQEEDVEDVVHGSIDIPDEILEEMHLQGEDAVERARKDLDSEGSDSKSQISSLGLTTDSLGLEEEYGVEMNIPSSGKAVEIVGTGPMILEPETIMQADEKEGKDSNGKKAKWGLLRMFKSKPKHQKVSSNSTEDVPLEKIEAVESETEGTSSGPTLNEPETSASIPVDDSSYHEPDRYSVAAPKAALADDMEECDSFSDDEEEAPDSFHQSEEDEDKEEEDDDVDDRYRIGPPKKSNSESNDGESVVSVEQEMIPNRAEDRKPVISLQIDCHEEATVVNNVDPSVENADGPPSVHNSPELRVDEVDKVDDIAEQEEENLTANEATIRDEKTTKRKSKFGGIFGRRKTKIAGKKTSRVQKASKASKADESLSMEADEMVKNQPPNPSSNPSKTPKEPKRAERSPVASIKGDSMTVIANAISKGALMAVESNLETEGTIKSRRLRTRADSSKDVIDLIRERTQKYNGKRQDPLDSSNIGLRMSMSKDPSGTALSEPKTEQKERKSLMHLAPTPRAKKTVDEKLNEEHPSSEISHQQQITERLYGNSEGKSNVRPATKVSNIEDLLKGVSTDPTVDSVVSDEKETNVVVAAI
ncbi:unnamed protein product [Cylindrotheca closterium]|uniref:Uncharacterized protein n=1 Tax=Cylindrotheca closterium TaxID=2856 RepID=A0AAD2JJA2_9STRA|nr:unnamed protein product [Cylindrotheca closterium]